MPRFHSWGSGGILCVQTFSCFGELKGLRVAPKDLVHDGFLDTFFLFLIYTEVDAVGWFIPRSTFLYLAGVKRVGLISRFVVFPRQFNFILN